MDWLTIQAWALALVPIALAATGWLVKRQSARIDAMDKKISGAHEAVAAHRLHTAENYVTREALRETENRLVDHLNRIENKLDARQ